MGSHGFTKKKYLTICELQKIQPNPKEMPMSLEDFPPIVPTSIEIFNSLPDNYCSTDYGPMYTGKDISSISILWDLHYITDRKEQKLCLQLVQHIDSKAVKKSRDSINKAAKKANSK